MNDRILAAVDSKLAEAQDQLREGEAALEQARKAFEEESSAKTEELTKTGLELEKGKNQLQQGIAALNSALQTAETTKTQLTALRQKLQDLIGDLHQNGTDLAASLTDILQQAQALGLLTPEQAAAILAGIGGTADSLRESLDGLLQTLDDAIAEAEAGIAAANSQKADLSAKLDEVLAGEQKLEQGKLALATASPTPNGRLKKKPPCLSRAAQNLKPPGMPRSKKRMSAACSP